MADWSEYSEGEESEGYDSYYENEAFTGYDDEEMEEGEEYEDRALTDAEYREYLRGKRQLLEEEEAGLTLSHDDEEEEEDDDVSESDEDSDDESDDDEDDESSSKVPAFLRSVFEGWPKRQGESQGKKKRSKDHRRSVPEVPPPQRGARSLRAGEKTSKTARVSRREARW